MKLPRTVRVDVTQDDIDNGIVSNDECPIALAFRRAANWPLSVFVDSNRIDATEDAGYEDAVLGRIGHIVHYVLPDEAHHFVEAFDDPCVHGEVEPFSFEVTRS